MSEFGNEFRRNWLISTIGVVLLSLGICLLTWNEGQAVHQAHSLDEAFSNVVSLNAFDRIQPEYEGRLVHITGPLRIDEPLTQPDYGISIQAVKLKRRVQMYQWVEEVTPREYEMYEQDPHNSDYYYVTEWRDNLVDSNSFYVRRGHNNPKEMPLKTKTFIAPNVKIGYLELSGIIKNKFNDFVEVTSDERPDRDDVKLHMGIYYHCFDVWNPEIGDIRIQFYYAGLVNEMVTVIAMQKDGFLVPYITQKKHEIALLRIGNLNINQMFNLEHSDNRFQTWKMRLIGFFIIFAATTCLDRLIKILLIKLTIFNINRESREMKPSAKFGLSVSASLVIISAAWILYRPVLGLILMSAAFGPAFFCGVEIYHAAQE